ncbi:uncharacterized protein LOC113849725 isoform X3 [Abrus precatorius]|uniref:Uncharacterized protein LOC113849725 isoform X3 n=1 Tax=Abrus precatorius TaxID=3816 RepID=A0A8B8JWB5_ABRPR|nr:uncharacterized protein LOC113849725 isoform X3 [Abrus precatorius]
MQALRLRLSSSEARPLFRLRSYLLYSSSCCSAALLNLNSLPSPPSASSMSTNLFTFPWSAFQCRGIKVSGSDVLKVDHSHEGRGKATIKVELRDIGQGNKVTQRMGTDEDIERVFVRERTFMFMCMDHDGTVVLMDPDTLDQMEVSKDLFGKNCLYLQVPKRVTCNVKEGIAATPRNKKVVLDNGLSVEVPPHIVAGDAIVVNTEDDSYIERAKA